MNEYTYGGARALIALHDQHMRSCLEVWKRAKKSGIVLPKTTDPSYKSMMLLYPINQSTAAIVLSSTTTATYGLTISTAH